MDTATREKYGAWMWRRIFKRIIIPCVLLLIVLIGLVLGLRSCGSDEPQQIPYSSETDVNDTDTLPVGSQPTYQDFDFTTYNEDAIVEIGADYLDSYLVLVNKVFRLSEDFSPEDLVLPDVLSVGGGDNTNNRMREVAARALEDMFNAARVEEGLELWAVSGYRSFEEQRGKHQYFIDTNGYETAESMSARPGHSEHQTGLVMDVTAASVDSLLTEEFSNVPEGVWLRENAYRFGFIIRYPYGRMNLTGIVYEPWHVRYVGIEAATYIFENNIVLEQYIFPVPSGEQS